MTGIPSSPKSLQTHGTDDLVIPQKQRSDTWQKAMKVLFYIIFSPVWLVVSIFVEIIVIPFHVSYNMIKLYGDEGISLSFMILLSPVILALFILVGIFLMPISVIKKTCNLSVAEKISQGLKMITYPSTHPLYGNYLDSQFSTNTKGPVFSLAETDMTTGQMHNPYFEHEQFLFPKTMWENSKRSYAEVL